MSSARLIAALADGKLPPREIGEISNNVLARATDLKTLHTLIDDVAKRLRRG
jgi:hypothetical protein